MTAKTFPVGSSSKDDQPIAKKIVWTGRIISGVVALFLFVDGAMKLWKPAVVLEATRQLGYAESQITAIGALLLAGTLLYVFPRTAIFGAILLTGYLGGAVSTHVRAGEPFIGAVGCGVLVWLGLFLRNSRLRGLILGRS